MKHLKWHIPLSACLALIGACMWAQSDDLFRRLEINLEISNHSNIKGILILPKPIHQYPFVIYMHGFGGNIVKSGTELRQFAELGMGAICLDYNQTNQNLFDDQFLALLQFLRRQPWAMTNSIVWVGSSLGAQRLLSFSSKHPDIHPELLVCISGGWVSELGALAKTPLSCPVLIVHGDQDDIFSDDDAQQLMKCLTANGSKATEKTLHAKSHSFAEDRALVTRLIAEYSQSALAQRQPFRERIPKRKLHFLFYLLPIFAFLGVCWCCLRTLNGRYPFHSLHSSRWDKGFSMCVVFFIVLTLIKVSVHLFVPELSVTEKTLAFARWFLVSRKIVGDFDTLSSKPLWQGRQLKNILEHTELANYNRNELANWKEDDQIYNEFILSPTISASDDFNWRRILWESFYPRIRKEQTPEAAATIVIRYLRERVTISSTLKFAPGIESAWNRQITDEAGFEMLYVAAMRSVGIGARLNASGRAEFWTGNEWKSAPRPIASSFL